ncbi:hypothetical protein PHLCEN_2v12887 [Hermanssonia centrifuga]|uniref:Uncharacterized protein n=1 Tax=Hermanssonia centrifuga TaxID=98765 RepID=A0A2R6NFT6_9APHY|nr:hypothetical protein PHLCEN_2v12887 [Hermanssonia centrifuga]
MYELACVGDLPLPEPSPPPSHKRERDSDSPISNVSSAPSPSTSITTSGLSSDEPRHFAGSRRVVSSIQQRGSRSPSQSSLVPSGATGGVGHSTSTSTLPHFTLPIHSADLGRLPFNAPFGDDSSLAPGNTGWLSADYMQPGLAHIHPYSQATTPTIPPDNLFSQTTEMDASYSSTMYDQVMSNLAGSMAPVSQYPSSVDPQRMPLPTESLDHLLTSLGSDGVMFPNDNGVLSMWSSAPTGFE